MQHGMSQANVRCVTDLQKVFVVSRRLGVFGLTHNFLITSPALFHCLVAMQITKKQQLKLQLKQGVALTGRNTTGPPFSVTVEL